MRNPTQVPRAEHVMLPLPLLLTHKVLRVSLTSPTPAGLLDILENVREIGTPGQRLIQFINEEYQIKPIEYN